jgi:hypothetical protein
MTVRPVIASIALITCAAAQSPDNLVDAVLNPERPRLGKSNEVTVVLPPPDEPIAPRLENSAPKDPPANDAVPFTAGAEESTAASATAPPDEPAPGLAVRVEKIQNGGSPLDAASVKLLAPFPAKPLSQAPAGWRFEASESTPPFTREVELAPGKAITLSVRPHLLIPQADGSQSFQIPEPGYDPALGYRQGATVGAVLASSIRHLEQDSQQLGTAIDQLQQLLVSLPKPEPVPQPAAPPADEAKPATPIRKR